MDQDRPRKPINTPAHPSIGAGRGSRGRSDEVTAVRLTRKYADMIDGVNLKDTAVGDRLELSRRDADVLIAEGWAEFDRRLLPRRAIAADHGRRPRTKKTKS
jgi:hypothetical protein